MIYLYDWPAEKRATVERLARRFVRQVFMDAASGKRASSDDSALVPVGQSRVATALKQAAGTADDITKNIRVFTEKGAFL